MNSCNCSLPSRCCATCSNNRFYIDPYYPGRRYNDPLFVPPNYNWPKSLTLEEMLEIYDSSIQGDYFSSDLEEHY